MLPHCATLCHAGGASRVGPTSRELRCGRLTLRCVMAAPMGLVWIYAGGDVLIDQARLLLGLGRQWKLEDSGGEQEA